MSDFEEKRLASNAYNRAQASHYESLANQYQKAYDKKKAEIEKLESARKELSKQIQSYSEFRNTVSQYSTTISTDTFKGTRRDTFDKTLSKIATTMNTHQNDHEMNLAKLEAEIAKRKLELGDLGGAIGSAWNAVESFLAAIF